MLLTMLLVAAVVPMGGAQQDDTRDKIPGSWQLVAGDSSSNGEVWTVEQKGEKVHITRSQGGKVIAEFECGTQGGECDGKDEGKKTKVSLWYNGPKLVALETKGSDVVKRRFEAAADGNQLKVEVIPVVPAGKTETLQFKRAETTEQAKQ